MLESATAAAPASSSPHPQRDWLSALRALFAPAVARSEMPAGPAESATRNPASPEDSVSDAGVAVRAFWSEPAVSQGSDVETRVGLPAEKQTKERTGLAPSVMMNKMADALHAHAALTERYARAGYQIGRLEAEVKSLQAERKGLQVKLLETEQLLADSRLNEQVLQAERDRALTELQEALVRLAQTGSLAPGGLQAVRDFLRRHW